MDLNSNRLDWNCFKMPAATKTVHNNNTHTTANFTTWGVNLNITLLLCTSPCNICCAIYGWDVWTCMVQETIKGQSSRSWPTYCHGQAKKILVHWKSAGTLNKKSPNEKCSPVHPGPPLYIFQSSDCIQQYSAQNICSLHQTTIIANFLQQLL